jgi:hypothetical protein
LNADRYSLQGGLSPPGPRKARPDDRLRRNPPFTYNKTVGYAFR